MIYIFSWFIWALFMAAFAHFIYEGIVGPSLRMQARYRFFILRDELRAARCENDAIPDDVFYALQDQLNNGIAMVSAYRLSIAVAIERFVQRRPGYRDELRRKMAMVQDCSHPTVQRISKSGSRELRRVLLINSGGWFLYLVPIAVCAVLFNRLRRAVMDALFLPVPEVNRQKNRFGPPEGKLQAA